MKDTEGRTFDVTCTEKGGCQIALRNGTGASTEPALTLRADGRVLGVCERDGPPITCRAVLCSSDENCPTTDGVVRTCENSLCSEPSRPLSRADVVMLCMAGSGLGYDQPLQRERYATALAWRESNSLPTGCRKP